MRRILALCSILLLLVPLAAVAQEIDYCEGNFDYDDNVDGLDAAIFKSDFGRSSISDPCPACAPLTPVFKTGQTLCYDELGNVIDCAGTGQDGEYQLGYERFIDNGNGTVTDNFTKLIWLKDANCIAAHYPAFDQEDVIGDGGVTWQHALDFVKGVNDGTYPLCGAGHNDWRLPNVGELKSIADPFPFLQPPFANVQLPAGPALYWSSTTHASMTYSAWLVGMDEGSLHIGFKSQPNIRTAYVWAVRGTQ
jgi:hypothetical protein